MSVDKIEEIKKILESLEECFCIVMIGGEARFILSGNLISRLEMQKPALEKLVENLVEEQSKFLTIMQELKDNPRYKRIDAFNKILVDLLSFMKKNEG